MQADRSDYNLQSECTIILIFLRNKDANAHYYKIITLLFKIPLFHELVDDGRYTYTLWCSIQHGITGVSFCMRWISHIVSVEQLGRVGRHSSVLSLIRVSTSFATWGFQGALDACNTVL